MVDAISTGSRISPLIVLRRHSVSAFVLTTALAALVVVIDALRSLGVSRIWDDAYMFERYAYNLLREGRIAWNPGGEPTYGLTSPAFLAVVGPLVAILGERPAHVATLASALSGFLFLALLGLLVLRYTDAPRVPSWMALMLVTCCLAVSNTTFHFGTGMDTTFSLAFATVHLIVAHCAARKPAARTALVLGVVGGLAYLVRPELVLQALLLPASMLALSEDRAARRCGGLALVVTVTVLLLVLGACAAYFDSPLPLPFYAKSTGLYGPGMEAAFRGFSTKELLAFVARYWPLFLIVLLDLPNHVRRGPASPSPVERGALIATVLLITYHWLMVLPVMGYSSRFYQLVVPALAYLTATTLGRWHRTFEGAQQLAESRTAVVPALAALVLGWSLLVPATFSAARGLASRVLEGGCCDLDHSEHTRTGWPSTYWYRLDRFASLPDDLVIATTEVGLPGVLAPRKTIVDLAGLNDSHFARQPFSAERLFARYRPDLIYMPHPNYVEMNRAIEERLDAEGYDFYTARELDVDFGLAIRRDSRHYDAMRRIVEMETGAGGAAAVSPAASPEYDPSSEHVDEGAQPHLGESEDPPVQAGNVTLGEVAGDALAEDPHELVVADDIRPFDELREDERGEGRRVALAACACEVVGADGAHLRVVAEKLGQARGRSPASRAFPSTAGTLEHQRRAAGAERGEEAPPAEAEGLSHRRPSRPGARRGAASAPRS